MKRVIAVVGIAVLLAGCNSKTKPTPENYLATINAYLPDHADCLLDGSIRFPYETTDPAETKRFDTLVKAQVLDVTREPAIHISRYTLTPTGIKARSNLCFGYRNATEIVSSTPPALANTFTETQVVYRYVLLDEPMWAKTPEVMAAFPKLAAEASGNATDTITLALTRVGWSVPN